MNHIEQKSLILRRIEPWAGSIEKAEIWYMNEIIPSLDCTANEAIESENFEALSEYIDIIEIGGFA